MAGLIVLLLGCMACTHVPVVPDDASTVARTSAQNDVVELRVGATAALPGTTASVTFVRVASDGRCPKGVQCVWEGDAAVELRVPSGADAKTITLHTNARFERQAEVGGVTVTLESLEPYPESGKAISSDSYVVMLRVSPR